MPKTHLLFLLLFYGTLTFGGNYNYTPYLKELSILDTAFSFDEVGDTLYLNYGVGGHRIEVVNDRIYKITPLNRLGQINGLRRTYTFYSNKGGWPWCINDEYSNGIFITEYEPKKDDYDIFVPLNPNEGWRNTRKDRKGNLLYPPDTIFRDRKLENIFSYNDSINKTEERWWINDLVSNKIHIGSFKDSIRIFIEFRNAYFNKIGFIDNRKNHESTSFYLFDEGKFLGKIKL